jgi:crotonobetainyl-CoA:carnitine CoA-transferase CaiB-like acyl-CoA transferase
MSKAIGGFKILDFVQAQSATTCSQLLAWLGLGVIKIDHTTRGMNFTVGNPIQGI